MNNRKYVFLDGIRGIAAIFVLTRHTSNYWHVSFPRSYLAVDLFFMLSGFVIACAYDEKLRTGAMSFRDFVIRRGIRLYPVFLLSVALCTLVFLSKHLLKHEAGDPNFVHIAMMVGLTALFLPFPLSGNVNLFPLNNPYWSIFFELLTNFLYALMRPILSIRTLLVIIVVSGGIMAFCAFENGDLDIGYDWGPISILGGFSRAMFGIFCGILLFRRWQPLQAFLKLIGRRGISPWLAVAIVALVLASPSVRGFNPMIDLLSITLVFPLSVWCLANGAASKFDRALLILGSASYPIYLLHVPVSQALTFAAGGIIESTAPWSGACLVALLISLSLVVEKTFDVPMRRWLSMLYDRSSKKTAARPEPLSDPLPTSAD